ncbi:MAG: copper amine oxidase N-terminal domain-containing protein [Eubacteriales bacterium]|nr:copper amine oxidase N-terminal domain-containing protein [Eubacteriales bacterium]
MKKKKIIAVILAVLVMLNFAFVVNAEDVAAVSDEEVVLEPAEQGEEVEEIKQEKPERVKKEKDVKETEEVENENEVTVTEEEPENEKDGILRLREAKRLVKEEKIELRTYLKEMRELFPDMTKEERKELLKEIAEAKKELKDFRIETFIGGKNVDYEKYDKVYPVIKSGRTIVPIRALTEAYGCEVKWDEENQKVTIIKDNIVIEMVIDELKAYVNGEEFQLDAKPELSNGRTVVPVRFVAESLKLEVIWDEESNTVIVE